MNTLPSANKNHIRVMWTAVSLAFFTALSYLSMQFNILGVGDLEVGEKPAGIIYVAAGCYLLGGLLILLRNRWLLLFGVLINAIVVLFFLNLYQNRPSVMFSPGGIVTKVPQLLLETTLIYLIVTDWLNARHPSG